MQHNFDDNVCIRATHQSGKMCAQFLCKFTTRMKRCRVLLVTWIAGVLFLVAHIQDSPKIWLEKYSSFDSKNLQKIRNAIKNNSLRCIDSKIPQQNDIRWSQRRWQKEVSEDRLVFLYSAIYDDRPMAGPQHFVRINLMATYSKDIPMFCHFWYDKLKEEAYVQEGLLNETGINRMQFKEGGFREYILSCRVPFSEPLPTYVSVTRDKICKSHHTLLPVIYEYHKEPPIEFGMCVVNGHGYFTAEEMVEWFEFYRLMGVKEFNLYNTSYEGVNDVFDYYIRNNLLVFSQIPHPLGPNSDGLYDTNKIRNLRTTCLNDCMMRNMYRYRYLVVVDHDEFIVPRNNITNYHDLIREITLAINVDTEIMSIGFVNTYFLKTFPPDLYKPKHMKTLRFRYRTKPLQPYTGSKSILKPLFCFNLMNHYCYFRLPLYDGKVSYFSPNNLAMSHHYRYCGKFTGTATCNELHGQKLADDIMLSFEKPLRLNVEKVLGSLGVVYEI